jgi:hypothetical protein
MLSGLAIKRFQRDESSLSTLFWRKTRWLRVYRGAIERTNFACGEPPRWKAPLLLIEALTNSDVCWHDSNGPMPSAIANALDNAKKVVLILRPVILQGGSPWGTGDELVES